MTVAAFAPTTTAGLWGVIGVLVSLLVVGGVLQRTRRIALAWVLGVAGFVTVERLTSSGPSGYRMIALCGAMLYGMKAVVGAASSAAGHTALPSRAWLTFAALWFGMRPKVFHPDQRSPRSGSREIAASGIMNIVAGTALFACAHWAATRGYEGLVWICGLPALSLWMHFGVFHLSIAYYRARGYDVKPLFRNPLASRSLTEFWGRRWNIAFSEMTALAVHRPLRARIGTESSVATPFLFSGILHELAISAPVRTGWGMPLGYFTLHAAAMNIERRISLEGRKARLWTYGWVLVPLPLLFHSAFRDQVIAPLLGV